MASVICSCKYYRTNVLRIVLRHLQIPLICRSSHDLDDSEKFGNRINQFYLCTQAYSVVLPIRSAPTLHNKINFHAGILRKLQIERLVLENWKMQLDLRWIFFWIIHTCPATLSTIIPGSIVTPTVGLLASRLCGIKA